MMRRSLALLALAGALLSCSDGARAQNNWSTPGGSAADGVVMMCLNAQGLAIPTDQNGACPGGTGGGNGLVQTSPPNYTNGQSKPITTGTDGGIVETDDKALGPTTVSSAVSVFTFITWPYEYVHIDVAGNNGSQWVLECSDASGAIWYPQPLTTDDRTFVTSTSFAGTLFSSMNSRISDNQCRVRVSVYGSPDSLTFSAQLRKTGSEPVSATNVQNQVKIQNTRGSSDPSVGFSVATTTYYSSSALESGHVIKASSGVVTLVCAWSSAAVILQVFDSATVPADNATVSPAPVEFVQVPANTKNCTPNSPGGLANHGLANGLSVACSTATTPYGKTASATCGFEVRYQ